MFLLCGNVCCLNDNVCSVRCGRSSPDRTRHLPPTAVPSPVQPGTGRSPPRPSTLQELLHSRPQTQGQEACRGTGTWSGKGVCIDYQECCVALISLFPPQHRNNFQSKFIHWTQIGKQQKNYLHRNLVIIVQCSVWTLMRRRNYPRIIYRFSPWIGTSFSSPSSIKFLDIVYALFKQHTWVS